MECKKKIAVYPGSFDPITNGHMDIIKRSLKIFDEIIVLVAINAEKKSRFPVNERVTMIEKATKNLKNVRVESYGGLSVEFAKKNKACAMIRGLRAVSDFEYELSLFEANQYIDEKIEMVFFMATKENSFISSSNIMTMLKSNVDISNLVPKEIVATLKKYKN